MDSKPAHRRQVSLEKPTPKPQPKDSRSCGGAVVALQKLGKVSDLSGRAFHNFCNTAALPTQDRIPTK